MQATLTKPVDGDSLVKLIEESCGSNIYLCYQCKKCTAGCPVVENMDLTPAQMLRAIQLGRIDQALRSKTIWLCSSCQTCVTRCPQGLDLPKIMDLLKVEGEARGILPRVPNVAQFNHVAVRWIKTLGRLYELGLMAEMNLRTRRFFKDVVLGLRLLAKGRLKLLPPLVRYTAPGVQARPALEGRIGRLAYYPGCALHSSAVEFDLSTRAVADRLRLELVEPKNWICCGSSPAHASDPLLAVTLPLRNLALIEESGESRVTMPCASCYSRFRMAIHEVQTNHSLAEAVRSETGYKYEGKVNVDHLLTTVVRDIGLEVVRGQVKKPLTGLKVVCYYGCLLTRPPEVVATDHPEYPVMMDHLLEALGGRALDWSYKTDCCGASLMLTETDIALGLVERILRNAKEVGAEAIVVACPLCHANLDTRQSQLSGGRKGSYNLPIFYFTELMGLAFAVPAGKLGLTKHIIDPKPLLKKKGLWS
ncbi:MAG: heterodisulfide reductase-related iron-sulfur binding cluster [Chloroflexi bacterium]|nr:heterodisulfide reductase-related iron-sulfur binding cluster [Chloroflexota bacterium]